MTFFKWIARLFSVNDFWVIFLCGAIGGGIAVGYVQEVRVTYAQLDVEKLKQQHATALAQASLRAIERVTAEQLRGNALSDQLAQAESSLRNQSEELKRALKHTTYDRPCLGLRTVRLLNNTISGHPAKLPTPSSESVAENGTTATDSFANFASDTDIAEWASTAITQYETCRVRLEKLIDFEKGREGKPNE